MFYVYILFIYYIYIYIYILWFINTTIKWIILFNIKFITFYLYITFSVLKSVYLAFSNPCSLKLSKISSSLRSSVTYVHYHVHYHQPWFHWSIIKLAMLIYFVSFGLQTNYLAIFRNASVIVFPLSFKAIIKHIYWKPENLHLKTTFFVKSTY